MSAEPFLPKRVTARFSPDVIKSSTLALVS